MSSCHHDKGRDSAKRQLVLTVLPLGNNILDIKIPDTWGLPT